MGVRIKTSLWDNPERSMLIFQRLALILSLILSIDTFMFWGKWWAFL